LAPILSCPEAPFGPRLAATCRNPWLLEPTLRRALGFAAAIESGWLMPMGFEYATVRAMNPRRDTADDFARLAADAAVDLNDAIAAANRTRRREPIFADAGDPRLVGGPGGPIMSVLRQETGGRRAVFIVLNADPAHRHDVPPALLADPTGSFVP